MTIDEAWQLAIATLYCPRAFAGASVGTPSVCQLPSGPSVTIHLQSREAVSVYSVFCSSIGLMMILNPKKYTPLKLKISTSQRRLGDGAHRTSVHSYWLDIGSETKF
jgi:hypothetical protein